MIVELFGLPGVGKTRIQKEITAQGLAVTPIIHGRLELIFWNAVFLVVHPIKSIGISVLLFKNWQTWPIWYSKLMMCLHRTAKVMKARAIERNNIVVIDEGQCQNCISFPNVAFEQKKFSSYFNSIRLPDKLLIIDLPEEAHVENIRNRGYYGRERFGEEYSRQWRELSKQNFRNAVGFVKNSSLQYKIVASSLESVEYIKSLHE